MPEKREYVKIADIIDSKSSGNVKLDIVDVKDTDIDFLSRMTGICEERYARLAIGGTVMMSETPLEKKTNEDFVNNAFGDILIGGLGIGMIVLAIQDSHLVKSITVVEKNEHVIRCVAPQLPFNRKVTIVHDDIFTYKPPGWTRYDCIYFDIWPYYDKEINTRWYL